ncbi:hypothetical protein FKP32DRAFT_1603648 [Trametes sanguinea]|nr:hypothetical protein FKP32DRAFT_1603648 [Trametes sanguinea]
MPSATVTSATIDPASRIDSREHDPRVVEMVHAPVCLGVLDYFLDYIVLTVASAMIGPPLKLALGLKTIKTASFIHSFVWATQLATPTLLVALVYIDRLKSKLSIDCEDWVCERLALGALITAEKHRDVEMEARMRWYAADSRYPPARPAKSPRFQPYSPPSRRYGSPTRPARSQQRPSQDYPWRSFRWSSGPRDDVWGPSGL